ncbi:alpha/beta hydrolase [Thiospirochaeta perfilievii]|uniref:alpha/beta hydrolase n=1 Tax=Thiospirochaeta perfilievii TaxID=252967 RepID=UPI00165913EA|nr:alpha/beta hydrolase [Thiospirochaeta perfilievii]
MKVTSLIFISILVFSCQTYTKESQEVLDSRDELRGLRSYVYEDWIEADQLFDRYFDEYTKDLPNSKYFPVWFNSIGEKMNGVIFTPQVQTKGTVLFIHGYAGNSRGLRYIGNRLLKDGYVIAALTLPGHGLAGGDRGDIDNFDDYAVVVSDFIKILTDKGLKPDFAVGHSTGGSSLIIYNQKYGWEFKKVILIAPLIHSSYWYTSKITRFITRPFIKKLDTRWTGPLAVSTFPMHWFDELTKWNKKLENYNKMDDEIIVLQGDKDRIVSWRYNIKFIKELYNKSEVLIYKDGTHTLFLDEEWDGINVINKAFNFYY